VEVADRSFEVVVRFENGVCVEDEQHVRVERACLLPDRRRLANRLEALNDRDLDSMRRAERKRARGRGVAASVVDDDDSPRPQGLPQDGREAANDVALLVERRDDDVDGRVAPVVPRVRRGRVGAPHQTDDADQRVWTENEVR